MMISHHTEVATFCPQFCQSNQLLALFCPLDPSKSVYVHCKLCPKLETPLKNKISF